MAKHETHRANTPEKALRHWQMQGFGPFQRNTPKRRKLFNERVAEAIKNQNMEDHK